MQRDQHPLPPHTINTKPVASWLNGHQQLRRGRLIIVGRYLIHQFIIGSGKECSGNCRSFFEIENRRPISPSQCTNSDFPTEIVHLSKVALCNLCYFIRKFSGVAIYFYLCPSVPEYVSVEQVVNASTESAENQLHLNIFFVFNSYFSMVRRGSRVAQ